MPYLNPTSHRCLIYNIQKLDTIFYVLANACNTMSPTNQRNFAILATSSNNGGTLINRNVWSNTDINMM